MTVAKVIDASAFASILFLEPEGPAIASRLADALLVAPELLAFEITNTLLKKVRRHPDQRSALLSLFRERDRLRVETMAVDQDGVAALAEQTGLTAYDASYLWLAWDLGLELVTLDKKLGSDGAPATSAQPVRRRPRNPP